MSAASGGGRWQLAWRRLREDRLAWLSAWLLAAFALVSLLAPLLPIRSPVEARDVREAVPPVSPLAEFGGPGFAPPVLLEPSAFDRALLSARAALFGDWQCGAWLGTDARGRDLLARLVWGGRTSLSAALVAALASLVIGMLYGGLAGYVGGRVDELLMRAVDALQSIPFVFFVIFVGTLLAGWRTELEDRFGLDREALFFLVIGAVWWLSLARIVRGQVRALRAGELVAGLRVLGASHARILCLHLLPAVLPLAVVYLALTVPSVMLFEAFLSFLGLGIEAPRMSWGSLAADGVEALNPVHLAWWLALFPALAMASVLLALNLFGDALRDALDPRGRLETRAEEGA